jgi:hypothetical protein
MQAQKSLYCTHGFIASSTKYIQEIYNFKEINNTNNEWHFTQISSTVSSAKLNQYTLCYIFRHCRTYFFLYVHMFVL